MTLKNLISIKEFLEAFYKDCYTTSESSIDFKNPATAELFVKEFKSNDFKTNFTLSGSSVLLNVINPINKSYIVSWFDIDNERKLIKKTIELGHLVLEIEGLNPLEALKEIESELSKYPVSSYIKDDNCSYSGGPEWAVYIDKEFPENNEEVINRLKNEARARRTEINKYRESLNFINSFS